MARLFRWPIVSISLIYAILAAAVLLGAFDPLVSDRRGARLSLCISVGLWWIVTYGVVKLVGFTRRNWRGATIVATSLLAAAAIAEVGIRVLHPGGAHHAFTMWPSERLDHEFPPNVAMYNGQDPLSGEAVIVRTNEDGLRTEYDREAFLAHETRIVVLGDSFAAGIYTPAEKILPAVLESLLRAELGREDVAVLNCGVVTYSPYLERIQFREIVSAYRPNLVLLLLDATDIEDDHNYDREAVKNDDEAIRFPLTGIRQYVKRDHGIFEGSALYQRLYHFIQTARLLLFHPFSFAEPMGRFSDAKGVVIDGKEERRRFFVYAHPMEKTRPYLDRTFEHIDRLSRDVHETGAEFALVVSPRYHHWNPKESPRNWERFLYDVDEPYQFEYLRYFDEKRADAGFPILNLLPAFNASTEFPLVLEWDPHWNSNGHRVAAEATAEFVLERGLVR